MKKAIEIASLITAVVFGMLCVWRAVYYYRVFAAAHQWGKEHYATNPD